MRESTKNADATHDAEHTATTTPSNNNNQQQGQTNMNTETQTATIETDAGTLRTILSALDLYTSGDKTRYALTLAQITPVVLNMTAEQQNAGEPATGLAYVATDSCTLVSITHRVAHTLTDPQLIDPAAILATMPKKATGSITLTFTTADWQLITGPGTTTGPAAGTGTQYPNTFALFQNQSEPITPYKINPDYLARLAKLAKTMKADHIRHISQGTKDGQPNNGSPLVYAIDTHNLSARIIIMPQRWQN